MKTTKFNIVTILFMSFLVSCSSQETKRAEEKKGSSDHEIKIDSANVVINSKPSGIEQFIDSMKTLNYLIDTNRIKKTIWSFMVKHPKSVDNGHQIIQLPFPVDKYSNHFANPKTYFFAQWNEREQTFKNGNDYLLMTWTIDSTGIENEKEIYTALHEFMGNFPCYIFRSEKTLYAVSHRISGAATYTRELTKRLRNFIDTNAIIYSPFGGGELK